MFAGLSTQYCTVACTPKFQLNYTDNRRPTEQQTSTRVAA